MKRYGTRLFVSLLTLSLGIAITSLRKSEIPQTVAPAPSVPVTTPTTATFPAPRAQPYISGDVRIVAVEFKEKNVDARYELDISYPQIDIPRTPQEQKVNGKLRSLIVKEIERFKAHCAKNRKYPDGKERSMDYEMQTTYEVLYATPELLSINLTLVSFTGYLNSDWYPISINYDLRAGRRIKKVGELFISGTKFLEVIAAYSVEEFMRRGLNCGGSGVAAEQWLREGTEPRAENYSEWNLTRNGLQINFGEYQVGPGCLGLVSVIVPYERLKGILRPNVQLAAIYGYTDYLPSSTERMLDKRFPGWRLVEVSQDVQHFFKTEMEGASPPLVTGDFDGNGKRDYAALIWHGQILGQTGESLGPQSYLVVFLQKGRGYQMHVLRDPQGEYLCLLEKGTKDYDYERQSEITYTNDAILTGIFEKAGSSYVYEKGRFRSFVSSD